MMTTRRGLGKGETRRYYLLEIPSNTGIQTEVRDEEKCE